MSTNTPPPPPSGPPAGPPSGPPPSGPPYGPPSGGAPPPGFNYQVPKKPFYRRPLGIVLIVVGVIILLSIIGGIAGGGDSDSGTPAADDSSDTKDSKSTDNTQKSEEAKPKATPKKWKTVAALRGNTNKAGPDFHLKGCDTRMTYNLQGDVSSAIVAFYVMDSGKKLQEDGGIPVASPTKSGPGNTTIRKDEGDYYIETVAANADWRVRVQEKC